MSDDWKVGDLAVCVDASDMGGFGVVAPKVLVEGRAYKVEGIGPDRLLNLSKRTVTA